MYCNKSVRKIPYHEVASSTTKQIFILNYCLTSFICTNTIVHDFLDYRGNITLATRSCSWFLRSFCGTQSINNNSTIKSRHTVIKTDLRDVHSYLYGSLINLIADTRST